MRPVPFKVLNLSFCGARLRVELRASARLVGLERYECFLWAGETPTATFSLSQAGESTSSVEWTQFEKTTGAAGRFRSTSTGLELSVDANASAAELALRGLFSRAIEAQGGMLVHSAGVSWGGRGALIIGPSGAGKSTLARWSLRAGGTLLSDEVVGVLPDGTLLGTPFWSDPDLQGSPTSASLELVTSLEQGDSESFEDRPAHELISQMCVRAERCGRPRRFGSPAGTRLRRGMRSGKGHFPTQLMVEPEGAEACST